MVVATAMRAVAPGLVLGALIAVADARALRALVYGVSPLDPAALGGALIALTLAALISSLLPASRATRVSPISAIRTD